jgi:ribosomal protein S21
MKLSIKELKKRAFYIKLVKKKKKKNSKKRYRKNKKREAHFYLP